MAYYRLLLWFQYKMSPVGSWSWTTGLYLRVVFWEVIESLWSGPLMEEVPSLEQGFDILSCLSVWWWNVILCLPPGLPLSFALVMIDLFLWNYKPKQTLYLLDCFLSEHFIISTEKKMKTIANRSKYLQKASISWQSWASWNLNPPLTGLCKQRFPVLNVVVPPWFVFGLCCSSTKTQHHNVS